MLMKNDGRRAERLAFKLARIMAEHIELGELTRLVLSAIVEDTGAEKAAFVFMDQHKVKCVMELGYHDGFLSEEFDELMHKMLELGVRPFIREELKDESVRKLFLKHDIAVSVPVRIEKNEVAVLILGRKKSHKSYTEEDLRLLNMVAGDVGAALENARSYETLKKFNEELERRVAERTRELEEAKERELAKAREVAKLKDEFVFIATHEIRTPVTVIKGFLEMVSESLNKFPLDIRKSLISIGVAADHLSRLVEDLLEVARSEGGSLRLNLAPHDAVPVIKYAVDELKNAAKEKKVELKINTKESHPPVLCDPSKLVEVVENLVSNAIKYNRENGKVDVNVREAGNFLITEVVDTGYGIPQDQQGKIFQKFARAHAKGTEMVTGTGLGLFLVRMLIEKMGGEIKFNSVESKGSTFTFSLPFVVVNN